MKTPYEFQERGLKLIAEDLKEVDSVVLVAPTGAGKCYMLCTAAYRFIQKSKNNVLITVHKTELLENARRDLFNDYGIFAQKIDADTKFIDPNARISICMVETFDRRSSSSEFMKNFEKVSLFIVDEVHITSFNKLLIHFYKSKRIGFTATTKTAKKEHPLNKYWHRCRIVATTEEMIELNSREPSQGVVPCSAYGIKNVDRGEFSKDRNGEFNEKVMSKAYRRPKHVLNTLEQYLKVCYGKKTVIFNVNIEHNNDVFDAFKEAGLNVRKLDSKCSDEYRRDVFKWLKNTKDAILCNVGIATTGFDEKSIECIIVNRSTTSLVLMVQMIGRGARALIFEDGTIKTHYILIDMGGNLESLKFNPNDNLPWLDIFNNPSKSIEGISPIKFCPECGGMNNASARICVCRAYNKVLDIDYDCGYIFPQKQEIEDIIPKELVQLFVDKISVPKAIEFFKDKHEWHSYDNVLNACVILAKEKFGTSLEKEQLQFLVDMAYEKAKEWYREKDKRPYMNFRHGVIDEVIKRMEKYEIERDLDMINTIISQYKKHGQPVTL